jgi:hypothetical protein
MSFLGGLINRAKRVVDDVEGAAGVNNLSQSFGTNTAPAPAYQRGVPVNSAPIQVGGVAQRRLAPAPVIAPRIVAPVQIAHPANLQVGQQVIRPDQNARTGVQGPAPHLSFRDQAGAFGLGDLAGAEHAAANTARMLTDVRFATPNFIPGVRSTIDPAIAKLSNKVSQPFEGASKNLKNIAMSDGYTAHAQKAMQAGNIAGQAAIYGPQAVSGVRDAALAVKNIPQTVESAKNLPKAAKATVNELSGRTFNGLKSHQIITNPDNLNALHAYHDSVIHQAPLSVPEQQNVVNAMHNVKNTNGLDFLSGAPLDRANRIDGYMKQWQGALPKYQATLANPKPSLLTDEAGAVGKNIREPQPNLEPSVQPPKRQLPATPNVVENRLTKGGKAGRQNLSSEVQGQISGEHFVRNTQALQDAATQQADQLPLDQLIQQAHDALAVKPGQIDDSIVAKAQQAFERADAAGRHADATAIHDALSEHLVKNGQTIQAASLLYRLSPQGLLYKSLRDLKKAGLSPEELTKVEAKLRSQSNDIKAATNLDAKERAMAVFHKTVADNMPKSAANGALSVWKAGLLSGIKTQGGNFVSNATFGALHNISNPIAAGVDKLISLKTGERTKTATLRGIGQGTSHGLGTGLDTMKTGIDARNIGGGKYEIHGELNFKNPVIQNVFGKTSNLVFRGMNAADQPFYYAALKNNLADLAKADGINKGLHGAELEQHIINTMNNPTTKIAETAKLAAQKAVLAQDSKIASSLTQFTQNHPAAQILAPFIKVPTNFLTRTLDYTPVGAIKEVTKQIQAGKLDQRALSEAIGEATTGSAVIYLGAQLANHNLLSGQYPQNDQKEAARWKAEGIQPNSVKIGRTWIGLNYLGPVGLLFGAGKDYIDAAKRGDNGFMQALTGFGKNLTGQSFLTGFSGFANAINDPQRSAKSFVNSQAGSIVPTWSADLANLTDRFQREANTVTQSIESRIPGARNTLPVKQDVYGNQLTQRTGAVNQLLNPLKPSDQRGNTVINEVSRLHSADPNNKDLQVTPTPINKSISINGQNIKLNNQQVHDLQQAVGQYTQQKWGELIQTKQYKDMTDAQKATALDNLRKTATEVATRDYITKNNIAEYNKPASKKAVQLANGSKSITDFAKTSTKGSTTKPDFNSSNDTEYKYLQAQYDDNIKNKKFTSDAQRIKAEAALGKAKIGADYSNQVRSLYSLSKAQLNAYLSSQPNGGDLYNQLKAYDNALYQSGANSSLKFKNGLATTKSGGKTSTRLTKSGVSRTTSKTASQTALRSLNSSLLSATKTTNALNKKVANAKVKKTSGGKIAFSAKLKPTKQYKLQPLNRKKVA